MMKIGLCALLSFACAQNNETSLPDSDSKLRGLPVLKDSDDEPVVVRVVSHEKPSFDDLVAMVNIASKRHLRGNVNIADLTSCDEDEKINAKTKISPMPEKTITFEYVYLADDDKK